MLLKSIFLYCKSKEVDKMVDSWLGERIRNYLKENRYTQAFIARKTGIRPDKLSASLNGNRRFTFSEYETICWALGVNTDKFLKPRKPEKEVV